jgi:hypothetical protein
VIFKEDKKVCQQNAKVKKAKSSFPKMDDTVSDTVHCTDYEYVKFTVHLYREFLSMHLGGRIIQYVYENKFILTNRVLAQLVHLYFFTTCTHDIYTGTDEK